MWRFLRKPSWRSSRSRARNRKVQMARRPDEAGAGAEAHRAQRAWPRRGEAQDGPSEGHRQCGDSSGSLPGDPQGRGLADRVVVLDLVDLDQVDEEALEFVLADDAAALEQADEPQHQRPGVVGLQLPQIGFMGPAVDQVRARGRGWGRLRGDGRIEEAERINVDGLGRDAGAIEEGIRREEGIGLGPGGGWRGRGQGEPAVARCGTAWGGRLPGARLRVRW